ncbi:MAG: hypothetical protein IKF56_07090 [Eggerthellaceae bacterium]|nr:hypothetical protein [Eggerthellaceae bacterium]
MAITPLVIADDGNVAITVDAMKVDSQGDPGYIVSITNRTSDRVYAYSDVGWTMNGADVDDAVLRTTVDPGQTVEEFMWFDHRNIGSSSLDVLEDVEGAIVIEDFGTSAVIGEYAFAA